MNRIERGRVLRLQDAKPLPNGDMGKSNNNNNKVLHQSPTVIRLFGSNKNHPLSSFPLYDSSSSSSSSSDANLDANSDPKSNSDADAYLLGYNNTKKKKEWTT